MGVKLLSTKEAAEYLGVTEHTLLVWFRAHRVPGIKLGHRTLRFRREDLDAFAEEHRSEAIRA